MPVDKTPVKIAREGKMLAILWVREDKMPILSEHVKYCTEDQVNWKSLQQIKKASVKTPQ